MMQLLVLSFQFIIILIFLLKYVKTHHTFVQNIERILEKQKSSANNLGIDAFVQSVNTTEEQFKKGEYYYFISTSTALIELTSSF